MTKTIKSALTSKWLLVVQEYELVKQKKSKNFTQVQQICNAFKVHRKDIRKYYERWIKSGKNTDALLPQKRGPKPGTLKLLNKDEERTIISLHRKLAANEFEIYYLIKGYFRVHPSVSTIYRTLRRYPLNKKRIQKIKRYEKKYPGEQAHSDTCQLAKTFFIHRKKRYLFGLLDDCTRLCYTELIPDIKAATVTKAFFRGYKWFAIHGINIKEVLTDNGSEFTAYTSQKAKKTHLFETMLKIIDVKHRYTRPYRPQTNGKIERFWRTLNDECIRLQTRSQNENELIAELNGFMYRYNYQRRHSALKYITPFDKLKFVTQIVK
jgi:transposase InsO family protein